MASQVLPIVGAAIDIYFGGNGQLEDLRPQLRLLRFLLAQKG